MSDYFGNLCSYIRVYIFDVKSTTEVRFLNESLSFPPKADTFSEMKTKRHEKHYKDNGGLKSFRKVDAMAARKGFNLVRRGFACASLSPTL
jgi:hypothetical protein